MSQVSFRIDLSEKLLKDAATKSRLSRAALLQRIKKEASRSIRDQVRQLAGKKKEPARPLGTATLMRMLKEGKIRRPAQKWYDSDDNPFTPGT